jgi:hypothetical protein
MTVYKPTLHSSYKMRLRRVSTSNWVILWEHRLFTLTHHILVCRCCIISYAEMSATDKMVIHKAASGMWKCN